MTIFLAYILRLIVVFSGFALASMSASVFFVVVGVMPMGGGVTSGELDFTLNFFSGILFFTIAVAAFSSTLVILPAFVLAVFSEYFGWNGFLFHGVAGAVLGASAAGFWHLGRTVDGESHLVVVGMAAGIVGASVYWLIAGRRSGQLFEKIMAIRAKE